MYISYGFTPSSRKNSGHRSQEKLSRVGAANLRTDIIREFKDAVFEDVAFDNDSFVTIYCGKLCYYVG